MYMKQKKTAKIGKSIHKRKCKADDEVLPFFSTFCIYIYIYLYNYLFFLTIFSPRSFNRYSNDVSCRNVSQDRYEGWASHLFIFPLA